MGTKFKPGDLNQVHMINDQTACHGLRQLAYAAAPSTIPYSGSASVRRLAGGFESTAIHPAIEESAARHSSSTMDVPLAGVAAIRHKLVLYAFPEFRDRL
jgi:hypothetical protein